MGGLVTMNKIVKGGNCNIEIDLDNKIAIKTLRNTSSKERILRFKKELNIVKEISECEDYSICKILNINIDKNIENCSYTMKLYDGNLYDIFSLTKGNAKKSCELILPIIKTLKKLEERENPIYHRDIKPDNILYSLVNNEPKLYLSDFGNAYIKNDTERITPPSIAVGGRMFIAPEYEIGRVEEIDSKGDIFSIGKVLWCMVNGNPEEYLPSNFWFIDEYNLTKKYKFDQDILKLNIIIASCLNINPNERCDYATLIESIEDLLSDNENITNCKAYEVKEFANKRKIELQEILEKNKQLVNAFSVVYISVLKKMALVYEKFPFIMKLLEYEKRSSDGVNYWTINVINNSAHYLYSTSYDLIYISLNYNPPINNEKYANINISYTLKNGYADSCIIKYDEKNNIFIKHKNDISLFNEKSLILFMDNLINNYIKN